MVMHVYTCWQVSGHWAGPSGVKTERQAVESRLQDGLRGAIWEVFRIRRHRQVVAKHGDGRGQWATDGGLGPRIHHLVDGCAEEEASHHRSSRERWWRLNPFHRPPFVSWCRGPSPSAVDIQRAIAWSIREIFLFANCAVQAAATRRGGSEVLPCCRQFVSLSSPSPRQSPRGDEWKPDSAQSICGLPPPQTAVGTQPQHACACGVEMMCGCQCLTRGRKPFFSARNNLHSLISCRIGTTRPPPSQRYGTVRIVAGDMSSGTCAHAPSKPKNVRSFRGIGDRLPQVRTL